MTMSLAIEPHDLQAFLNGSIFFTLASMWVTQSKQDIVTGIFFISSSGATQVIFYACFRF